MKLTQPHTLTVEGKLVLASKLKAESPKSVPPSKSTSSSKLFTWKPVPPALATTVAGVLIKARVHGMLAIKYSPQAIAVKLPDRDYWQAFASLDDALYTRPALRLNVTHPSSALVFDIQMELPNPLPHFVCEACGRTKRLQYLINIDAGPSRAETLGYSVCTICAKKGALDHIKYVRRIM